MSAGGNDADLVSILNLCVYSFDLSAYLYTSCDQQLSKSRSTIENVQFASKLDDLIQTTKSKLAPGGKIYYVGYAKFFDISDSSCDQVSWRIWLNIGKRQPALTQARRRTMNDLVDSMNDALRAAVSRAGEQVQFIDFDDYVGPTNGRYCQPDTDESGGNSANRQDLFFYEMRSQDFPWTEVEKEWTHDELKRRSNNLEHSSDTESVNQTLNALYGALIQAAIDGDDDIAVLDDDNANNDLEAEVAEEEQIEEQLKEASIQVSQPRAATTPQTSHQDRHDHGGHVRRSWNDTSGAERVADRSGFLASPSAVMSLHVNTRPSLVGFASGTVSSTKYRPTGANHTNLGTKWSLGSAISSSDLSNSLSGGNQNHTRLAAKDSMGTIIANRTHVLLGSQQVVSKFSIKQLLVSDGIARVFHPTQGGHALIANLILYHMAADNAKSQGIHSFPSEVVSSTGSSQPQIGGAACTTDSSDTWSQREAMISALDSFCADPHNIKGNRDTVTSETFNHDSLDYMNVSIRWSDNAVIGEHSCSAWLDVVTDGCDVPTDGKNSANLKHGGIIPYQSKVGNASLSIEPLVVRRVWDKGKAGGQQCNSISTNNYLDQATLQGNIVDYCRQSSAQPHGIGSSGSTFSQVFNEGTPSRVEIATTWPTGARNYQIFEEECRYYLSVLNNGCSLPGTNNAMNWKHGGSMSDNNGIRYSIVPTRDRTPAPSIPYGQCSSIGHIWGYSWELRGVGFAGSDFGAELQRQIRGCGVVTGWKFEYFDAPASDGTEWHAQGTLPLFISDHCFGKAIKSAGGFPSKC
ncbi:hypothetical protein M409DRAFT_23753 [Zasmidium cellare ATCC 36951]|uniref:Uncharacterized protein n=1 Tax=Zasmidium cellare ATCC 36951 TaxID=1080233 RepID=A0A6A6CFV3_ZASCE|nr:uncharacterized protein M409DRAFT_23753 [Zasmidium cellare ATCC 36951]KAF2166025.1 hypothetical protein M409DRAFT_23753 [Zasmidium cellare ATCC 36951]